MKLQTGIVGMPNVGKSTLFNALVGDATAMAANFPFCTIEPNVGIVNVPDSRLQRLGEIHKSEKVVHASMEFVDIAGIVKGASEGEGLGNKFLSNIRMTDAIVHVVRCFEDEDIIHVDGGVDPERDMEVISLELILADMAQVEKRLEKCKKEKQGKADVAAELAALESIMACLSSGAPASDASLSEEGREAVKSLMLLSMKPVIYAANVSDCDLAAGNKFSNKVFSLADKQGNTAVLVSAQVESELAGLDLEEKNEFLESLGVTEESSGLRQLVKSAYARLGLQTYFTSGPTETRAWTIRTGALGACVCVCVRVCVVYVCCSGSGSGSGSSSGSGSGSVRLHLSSHAACAMISFKFESGVQSPRHCHEFDDSEHTQYDRVRAAPLLLPNYTASCHAM